MSQKLCAALNLQRIGSDNLLIKTFGEESARLRSCDVVQLAVTSQDGMELYINAYSVPTICPAISNQSVKIAIEKYSHLKGLELADTPTHTGDVEVDLLIGADYYWNFFDGLTRQGSHPGPVALSSKLAWLDSVWSDCFRGYAVTRVYGQFEFHSRAEN